ncbi:MAG: GDP-mannose 4,6-dehydratase [Candidatus Dormibacteraeota bacterium]|uniref:GDP-mannose 4,6-dehydratase n=1 Tax=Candidatus Aeolococcus gillhamiae TaxID=3127015 RepID=A0A934K3P6_9BACT|nr:GDP-mannose 4,6-dehydratase [Candidatus Dormibacteraeota bacterium]
MRVVLTGAAGFIGSHLTTALLDRGDAVVAVDSFLTGRLANLQHVSDYDALTVLEHDVTVPLEVTGHVDAVMHFASPASPADYNAHPLATLDVGTAGTRSMLELARSHRARFLLASTSEVYGDAQQHPQREDYWGNVNPVGSRSVYDEAKRCAEAYTMAYCRAGLDSRIARIFNTYGERMRPNDGRAVPNFMSQALLGDEVTVYGDGSHTRSLCYISDLVSGVLLLLASDEHLPVNLGNDEEVTVLNLAQRILSLVGTDTSLTFRPLPEGDPHVRRPDLSRARAVLGWAPAVRLDEGLARTLLWFRSVIGGESRGASARG